MTVLRVFREFIENGLNLVCVDGVVADGFIVVVASDATNSKVDGLVLFLQSQAAWRMALRKSESVKPKPRKMSDFEVVNHQRNLRNKVPSG